MIRLLLLALVEEHGEPIGLALDVVLERLDQGLRLGGRAHAFGLHQARDAALGAVRRRARGGEQKAQQVARRLARGERLLGQARAELALQPQHQLDAREAVEAEVALERAVERDVGLDVRARLARHRGDYAEHTVGIDRGRKRRCGAHSAPSVHSSRLMLLNDKLLPIAREVEFRRGEQLLRQGEVARGAFVIRSGEVHARVALPGGGMLTVADSARAISSAKRR